MSETMSTPTDWVQFYQQNLSTQEMSTRVHVPSSDSVFGDQGSDTTVAATTVVTTTPPPTSSAGHLIPEGRVGKPVRRRSRASRRTPTTLLNTDTSNFRAMVQQFTGGPSAPFAAGGPSFGFGFGGRQPPHVNPNPLMVPPAAAAGGGFHLQYHHQQHNQPYMFSLNNQPGGGAELFLHRLGGNPRPNMEGPTSTSTSTPTPSPTPTPEGFMVEGISSQVPSSRTPSSNENRSSNATFLF